MEADPWNEEDQAIIDKMFEQRAILRALRQKLTLQRMGRLCTKDDRPCEYNDFTHGCRRCDGDGLTQSTSTGSIKRVPIP